MVFLALIVQFRDDEKLGILLIYNVYALIDIRLHLHMLFSLEIAAFCTRNGLDKATEYTLVARGARTTFCNLFVVS